MSLSSSLRSESRKAGAFLAWGPARTSRPEAGRPLANKPRPLRGRVLLAALCSARVHSGKPVVHSLSNSLKNLWFCSSSQQLAQNVSCWTTSQVCAWHTFELRQTHCFALLACFTRLASLQPLVCSPRRDAQTASLLCLWHNAPRAHTLVACFASLYATCSAGYRQASLRNTPVRLAASFALRFASNRH